MRKVVFDKVVQIKGGLIVFNAFVGNLLVNIIAGLFNFIGLVLHQTGRLVAISVDKDRYNHLTSVTEQKGYLIELELLSQAQKVRDNALETKTWTMEHTVAINQIGNALYTVCKWNPKRIHSYMRSVVESIPGTIYCAGGEEGFGDSND